VIEAVCFGRCVRTFQKNQLLLP